MSRAIWVGIASLAVALSLALDAYAMQWQPAPNKSRHGGGRMAAKAYILDQGEGAKTYLLHPDLAKQPLGAVDSHGVLKFKPSGKDNYHALIAVRESEKMTEAAIRYVYMHGKPTDYSPSDLTHSDKLDLEIVPNPLPREHWRYYSNQTAEFLIRFRGQPLGNFPVLVSTSKGSTMTVETNREGILSLEIPDDFTSVKPGRRNNPPAEWWLEVSHSREGYRYRTVLSASYLTDPNHWQPLSWGLGAVAGGMLFAGVLGFRRRQQMPARRPARSGRAAGKRTKE